MLEGKRNRRLDHLIYILVCKTVPYYYEKHRRQQYGFEGPDLEVQRRQQIEARAQTIPQEFVTELVEGQIYEVLSQSDAQRQYTVDVNLFTCDCASFPSILYCKHIHAVQLHFHEAVSVPPFVSILPPPQPSGNHHAPTSYSPEQSPAQLGDTSQLIAGLQEKLLLLSHRARQASSSTTFRQSLHDLDHALDQALVECPVEHAIIPSVKVKIAPNQSSWPETAAVMGVRPKGKKRRVHTDAYAGGEKSGKKAKADARVATHEPRYVYAHVCQS